MHEGWHYTRRTIVLAPNTLLQNRYLILSKIGQGGMGTVYQALDQRLRSSVAIKQMLP
jgi:eukaryotic-like serine/threonine-protein kinase